MQTATSLPPLLRMQGAQGFHEQLEWRSPDEQQNRPTRSNQATSKQHKTTCKQNMNASDPDELKWTSKREFASELMADNWKRFVRFCLKNQVRKTVSPIPIACGWSSWHVLAPHLTPLIQQASSSRCQNQAWQNRLQRILRTSSFWGLALVRNGRIS